MKKTFIFWLMAVVASLPVVTGGCCGCGGENSKCFPVIGPECSGETVNLTRGCKVMVKLVENPTTGYQWSYTNSAPGVCRVAEDKFIAPTSGLMGASGSRLIQLEAVAPGKCVLEFRYVRPWEKDQVPAEKYLFTISVK